MSDSPLPEGRILGVSGKTGSGKSILASWIVHDLKSRGQNYVFFPFSGDDATRQELGSFYRSAISQITKLPAFAKGYQFLQDAILQGQPSTVDLEEHLIRITSLSDSPLYWIVDGVDEAKPPAESFWQRTKLLLQRHPSSRFIVLSRHHSFGSQLLPEQIINLSVDTAKHDIAMFARTQTTKIPLLHGRPDLLDLALEAAVDLSDGMFLWTKLLLEDVARCGSICQVEEKLGYLPLGIDAMYNKMLDQIVTRHERDGICLQRARYILEIVASARRPMTVMEVQHAQALAFIAVLGAEDDEDESPDGMNDRSVEDYLLDQPEKRILELCSPLVVISRGVVSLVHSSAKEFLDGLGETKAQSRGTGTSLAPKGDHLLSLICLEHLFLKTKIEPDAMAPGTPVLELNSQYGAAPLHEYACRSLVYHVTRSLDSLLITGAKSSLYRFFMTGEVLTWLEECLMLSSEDGLVVVELCDELWELGEELWDLLPEDWTSNPGFEVIDSGSEPSVGPPIPGAQTTSSPGSSPGRGKCYCKG